MDSLAGMNYGKMIKKLRECSDSVDVLAYPMAQEANMAVVADRFLRFLFSGLCLPQRGRPVLL